MTTTPPSPGHLSSALDRLATVTNRLVRRTRHADDTARRGALALVALTGLLGSGCYGHECSEVAYGCPSPFKLQAVPRQGGGLPQGSYKVVVEAIEPALSETCTIKPASVPSCGAIHPMYDAANQDQLVGFVIDLGPEMYRQVTVRVEREGQSIGEATFTPTYVTTQYDPEPSCTPVLTCQQAQLLSLPLD